ncbi:hypothetical protein KFZ76_15450 [Methylovulum psychrotolerans]|uniref:hypothetical protein n=1 Tax=Methylovulum psychrotolerans TaxID=1704499 RepID=UPI001BFFCAA7|nr:hypothetical protein [Methylovulum psychrotolerans]MBT9099096.1 hypothetical protein [Methylovulum psychrotolerans]
MSPLEKTILQTILASIIGDVKMIAYIIENLVINDREFSEDALNKAQCCGFYLNFVSNEVLAGVEPLPHYLGIQASHKDLPVGADFIVFMNPQKGIDFLEAVFYSDTIPIQPLLSKDHGLTICS